MKFQTRVSLIVLFLTLFLAISLGFIAEFTTLRTTQRIAQAVTPATALLWEQVMVRHYAQMEVGSEDLARDFYIRQALKQQDRAELAKMGMRFFNLTREQGYFSRLQIAATSDEVLFTAPKRSARLGDYGFLAQVRETRKVYSGLQRDDQGKLVAVVAFPIEIRHTLIGVGIYIQTLQTALANFKGSEADSEIFIVTPDGKLDDGTNPKLYADLHIPMPPLRKVALKHLYHQDKGFLVVIQPLRDQHGEALAHLVSVRDHSVALHAERNFKRLSYALVTLPVILVLAGLYWFMARTLRPVGEILNALRRVASGDLDITFRNYEKGEIGQIKKAVKDMSAVLHILISQVERVSLKLHDSASAVQEGAAHTRQGLDAQNFNTEQVSAAVSELAASIRQIAQQTGVNIQAAETAAHSVNTGSVIITTSIAEVERLDDEISRISRMIVDLAREIEMVEDILKLIQNIADQTDRLALNAALEAGRAGESGRGFGVIAEEIRTLARRTHQSTEEIQIRLKSLDNSAQRAVELIATSTARAHQTVSAVGSTTTTLDQVSFAANNILEMSREIADATAQQSTVAAEISHNVANVIRHAESTALYARKTGTISEDLKLLADTLQELMSHFQAKPQ